MRILHVVHQYMPEYIGGTELYTQWLATEQVRQGHQVSIFYRRSNEQSRLINRTDSPGITVWASEAGLVTATNRFRATFGNKTISAHFKQVIDSDKPDIVHIQHLMGLTVELVEQLWHNNIPYVITLHDYWWVCANAQLITNYSQQCCNGPQAYLNCARCALSRAEKSSLWPLIPLLAPGLALRNKRLAQVLKRASYIIAPTEFVGAWYKTHAISNNKLRVIEHGLPIPDDLPAVNADHPFRFAYVGGLSWQKGVHVLIEAFNQLEGSATLWIAGDEQADPDYMQKLKELASDRVQFKGRLDREAVWQMLAEVNVVVVPSLWYETFTFVVSEVFAMKIPIIASDIGALSNRIEHEVNGLLVPPGNVEALRKALERFLTDKSLHNSLQAGIKPVTVISDYARQVETLYKQLVNTTG